MRRLPSLLLIVFVFVAVASFAADKRLSDRQMDTITAGQPGPFSASGAIVVGDSTASITKDNAITIDNGAGTDATALNFIVATGSFVGAGTNIWDGAESAASPEWVRQRNVITQRLGGGAYLDGYEPALDVHLGGLVLGIEGVVYLDNSFFGTLFGLDSLLLGVEGLDVRYGGSFNSAAAEFIVADDSDLTYSSTNSTTLDNGAMTGLTALNAVSAANSLVGLGLNLAVTTQDNQVPKFITQTNYINQRF